MSAGAAGVAVTVILAALGLVGIHHLTATAPNLAMATLGSGLAGLVNGAFAASAGIKVRDLLEGRS